VPVIVCSARVDDAAIHRSFDAGCDAYISKPFSVKYLMQVLCERLD
jgi:CheY-like chemotaxis protein